MRKLTLRSEVIKNLTEVNLTKIHGGRFVDGDTTAATDGNNGCVSEATGCPTRPPVCNIFTRACITTGTIVGGG